MAYLYVALGGALGSVMRAWLATVMTRLTGPQFPWGTILINILGSFVIGYVGALTAGDSRSNSLRAFVMVGICGGFTTFSSFSLQTLDLLRDGRPAQAAGNVVVSVLMCLLAVTAGHYSAGVTPRPAGPGARAVTPATVLVVLHRPDQVAMLLEAAERLPHERVRALNIRVPPGAAMLPSEDVVTSDDTAALRAEREDWPGRIADVLRTHPGVEAVQLAGSPGGIIPAQARNARIIVIARPEPRASRHAREGLHAALFASDRPVLVMPPRPLRSPGAIVAIAWQNDGRAEKAVQASLPILKAAAQVHVLHAGAAAEVPALLRQSGIPATCHAVAPAPDTGSALLRAAHQCGADLIVMGAFAHGAWREAMFGGVTRTMLAEADLPLFLRH